VLKLDDLNDLLFAGLRVAEHKLVARAHVVGDHGVDRDRPVHHIRPVELRGLDEVWVPKTWVTWADAVQIAVGSTRVRVPGGRCWSVPRCDDLRLVGLKLSFLVVTRAVSVLGLTRREAWWKDAEILMLRHQLAVAARERPRAYSRLTWPDRAWLALLAGTMPTERLTSMRLIVTPATILRWHRDIIRRRGARLSRRGHSGRPPVRRNVRSVVLRLARDNESWGYRRIHGELAGPGVMVAPSTVWQMLKDAGIDPAPRRDGPGWAEFLRSQAQGSWRWTSSPLTCSTARRCTSLR